MQIKKSCHSGSPRGRSRIYQPRRRRSYLSGGRPPGYVSSNRRVERSKEKSEAADSMAKLGLCVSFHSFSSVPCNPNCRTVAGRRGDLFKFPKSLYVRTSKIFSPRRFKGNVSIIINVTNRKPIWEIERVCLEKGKSYGEKGL